MLLDVVASGARDVVRQVAGDGPRILQRPEVPDVVVPSQRAVDEGLGERWPETGGIRPWLVLPDRHGDRCGQVLHCAQLDLATVLEDLGFDLRQALQTDPTVGLLGEAVVDVAGQEAGADLIERRPPCVSVEHIGTRIELGASAPRRDAHHVLPLFRGVVGKDDGLEQEHRREGGRRVALGQQQRRAAHRVPEPVDGLGANVFNDCGDVLRHPVPAVVDVGRPAGITVAAEVEGHDAKPVGELVGEELIHGTAQPGGVGDQQHLTTAAELVAGDLRSVVALDCPRGAHGHISTSTSVISTKGADVTAEQPISFETGPLTYRHWRLSFDGPVATVTMAVTPNAGLRDDYELKLNSYDLSVDIELYDVVQRLRFEHPEVKAVVVTGGVDKVFCAGANIQMLATSTHGHKVNFCKFTNETRNGIEDASANSGQVWIAAVNGAAAGGGYELALACDEILLIDDRASAVSLPEVPLLAVLPGTGGLTRLVDKRCVRRDLADVFATRTEGIKGQQAVDWRLVDAVAPRSAFDELVAARAAARSAESRRPDGVAGIVLPPLGASATITDEGLRSTFVDVDIDRELGCARFVVRGPDQTEATTGAELAAAGADAWLLRAALELDHAILHLRFNEPSIGTWTFTSTGEPDAVSRAEELFARDPDHWLVGETRLLWTRTLKRLDASARSLISLIEPGSCFVGVLAELVLAADRSLILEGCRPGDDAPPAMIRLSPVNDGAFPMSNGLTRMRTRFWGRDPAFTTARERIGKDLDASDAVDAELVTFAFDELDWDDEVRLMLEERNSFSPDALTGMEANFRFVGPETIETKIFARLSAWQNWIFQRPNAVGPDGALRRFGSGSRPTYDRTRV